MVGAIGSIPIPPTILTCGENASDILSFSGNQPAWARGENGGRQGSILLLAPLRGAGPYTAHHFIALRAMK
jgi:hypothetical protein